jgi:hypothetical protein
MFCPRCGTYNEDGTAQCMGCRASLDSTGTESSGLQEERSVRRAPESPGLALYVAPRAAAVAAAFVVLIVLTLLSGRIAFRPDLARAARLIGERRDRTRIVEGRSAVDDVRTDERRRREEAAGPTVREPSRRDALYSPQWVDGIEIGRADSSRAEFDYGRRCGWPERNVEAWYDLSRQRMRFGSGRWVSYSQLLDPLPEALQGPRDPVNANSQNPVHFIFRLDGSQEVLLEVRWLEAMREVCTVRVSLNGQPISESAVRSRSTTRVLLRAEQTRSGENDLKMESLDNWIRWDAISIRPTGRRASTEEAGEPQAAIPVPAAPPARLPEGRRGDIRLEAESLRVVNLSNGTPGVQDMEEFSGSWGGGKQFWFAPESVPASVTLQVDVPQARRYEIIGRFTKAVDAGIFTLAVDGQRLGPRVDGYSADVEASPLVTFGVLRLAAGEHFFEFRVEGQNPSAQAQMLGIDYLVLRPAR